MHRDLLLKLTNIYLIMPFYNYAYDSVKLIRSLCKDSRNLWLDNQDAISRMFTKQTIFIEHQRIDEKTIEVLKRGNRYKLFKFSIIIDSKDKERIKMFYKMLDEMPVLEIKRIKFVSRWSKDIIDTLLQKSIYKTPDELYKVLESNPGAFETPDTYEYLSIIFNPETKDMSSYVKQVGCIYIEKFNGDMNIDWL